MRQTSFGENDNLWLEGKLAKLRGNKIISQLKEVERFDNILDLGSGYNAGFLARLIKFYPGLKKAVGLDLSVAPVSPDKKIELIATDLNSRLPLSDSSFDVVTSAASIEHLSDPRLALGEMRRVLRNGGALFLTTPSRRAKSILEFLKFIGWLDRTEIEDHKEYFTAASLRRALELAGFDRVKIKTFQLGCNLLAAARKPD